MERPTKLQWLFFAAFAVVVYAQFFRTEMYLLPQSHDYLIIRARLVGGAPILEGGTRELFRDGADTIPEFRNTSTGLVLRFIPKGIPYNPHYRDVHLRPRDSSPDDYEVLSSTTFQNDTVRTNWVASTPFLLMHRVRDSRAIRYIKGAQAINKPGGETTKSLLLLSEALLKSHPEDIAMRMLNLDALTRAREFDRLLKRVTEWEADFPPDIDDQLGYAMRRARAALRWHRLESAGANAWHLLDQFTSTITSMDQRIAILPQVMAAKEAQSEPTSIGDVFGWDWYDRIFTCMRVFVQRSRLDLITGKNAEAEDLLVAAYHIGQLLSDDHNLGVQRSATGLRFIAASGLQEYGLNVSASTGTLEQLVTRFQALEATDRSRDRTPQPEWRSIFGAPDEQEFKTRSNMTYARFDLARLAIAARAHLCESGSLPIGYIDLERFFPSALPSDPFSSQPLNMRTDELTSSAVLYCYSVGPDKQDQFGKLLYDPTNGSISGGDILTTFSADRTYPYPSSGVRANTREEVLAAFPNGLPWDYFGGHSRGDVMKVTTGTPTMVWGFGPSGPPDLHLMDQEAARVWASYVPSVQYDPTNGIRSAGEMFVTLSAK